MNKVISDKDIIITDRIIFSNIAYEIRNQQNKVLMPHNKNSPITNHFQMSSSLKLDRKESFFLIGGLNDISYLLKEHEGKLIKKFSVSFNSSPLELYEVVFK